MHVDTYIHFILNLKEETFNLTLLFILLFIVGLNLFIFIFALLLN